MSEKQKKKNKIIGISIGILVVLLVVISSTYAYWQITKSQEGANDIIAACLDIDMESVDGTFGLNPAWPISDTEGMNLKGYTFKVTNNCEEDVNYIIGMDSLEVSGVDYLDYNSIKVSIDDSASMIYGDKETIEHIEENDQYTIRTSKKIATSTVRNGQPNEHNVKVWIKSDAPIEEQSRVFSGRMFITGGQNIEVEPQVKLIATGDISRNEECEIDSGGYSYNCKEVTGNHVNYYFYSDGILKLTGTGATKQYLYPKPNVQSGLVTLINEIMEQYITNENISLTEEELAFLEDETMVTILLILNDNPTQLLAMSDGDISTAAEYIMLLEEYDAATAQIVKSLVLKLSGFPKITDVIIDDGITSIGDYTFAYIIFENLEMADSVVELKEGAFEYGGFTESYELSANINNIELNVFRGLPYSGSFQVPNTITSLNDIISGSNVSEVILPNNKNITRVPYSFFEGMTNLTSIIIPENIISFDSSLALNRENVTVKIYGPEREIDGLIIENNENYKPFKEVIWNYQGE